MGGRPQWRTMTWVIILWCFAVLVWAIVGGIRGARDCHKVINIGTYSFHETNACKAGVGLGVAIILVIGAIGFVVLSLIWLMTKPTRRYCPACGLEIRRGATICPYCETDFLEMVGGRSAP